MNISSVCSTTLRRPAISAHGQGIAETAAYLVDTLQRIGLDARSVPTAGWPVVLARRDAIVSAQGAEPLLVPAMGGSLPDYVFTKILGVPAFVVPYANHDESNHAPNENMEVERFFAGIKTSAALLTYLGAMPPRS